MNNNIYYGNKCWTWLSRKNILSELRDKIVIRYKYNWTNSKMFDFESSLNIYIYFKLIKFVKLRQLDFHKLINFGYVLKLIFLFQMLTSCAFSPHRCLINYKIVVIKYIKVSPERRTEGESIIHYTQSNIFIATPFVQKQKGRPLLSLARFMKSNINGAI